MKKNLLICATMLVIAFVLGSCSSKKEQDPIAAIEALGEKISSDSEEWESEEWDKAADELKSSLDNLPSPLETAEEIKLSSAIMRIEMNAERHERKAAKVLQVLKEYEEKTGEADDADNGIDGSYDMEGTVDKYPITMHLDVNGEKVEGSYYYNRKGSDAKLTLSGKNSNGELDIHETDANGTPTGHFKGHLEKGIFKGTFITNNGKKMPFAVKKADADYSDFSYEEMSGDDSEYDDDTFSDDSEAGDASVDELLDQYEKYWQHYMSFIKKMDKEDPTALAEYAQMYQELISIEEKLDKVKGDLSASQLTRMNNIHMKFMQEAQKMQ